MNMPTGFPGIVSGRGDTNESVEIKADTTSQTLRMGNWVYNASTLVWQRMTQPAVASDFDDILDALITDYWKDQRYDYSAGDLVYIGRNTVHDAATSATTWFILKYIYLAGDLTRIEGPLTGSWDGRAALAWG